MGRSEPGLMPSTQPPALLHSFITGPSPSMDCPRNSTNDSIYTGNINNVSVGRGRNDLLGVELAASSLWFLV